MFKTLSFITTLLLLASGSARAQYGALWQKGDATETMDQNPAPKAPTSVAEKKTGASPVADDEDVAPRPSDKKAWGLTFKQKGSFGNQQYRMSDTSLDLEMPYGLDLNADLNVYSNSTSSMTPTVTFGAGWTNGMSAYTASYAITTLANNYEADSLDVGVSIRTDSEDFRTLLSVDGSETHHRNYIYIPHPITHAPDTRNQQDLSQRTVTGSVSQRIFGNFDAKITLAQSVYNRDLLAYTNALNRTKTAGQRAFGREDSSLTGLIDGFANWSVKFGLSYDVDAIPLTLRGTYQTIHLEDTAQGTGTSADVFTYAADYDLKKWLTLTGEYDHTRQTSQPTTDEYGGQVALRF
ncbi:MAG: hypothetical protein ACHQ2Z_14105 [Elusimicrobiota bacterium]